MRRLILGSALALAAMLPGAAKSCDLALALTVDVSGSIDPREFKIQMHGLADALADPSIAEALVLTNARVALVQWSGASRQEVSIPWTEIRDFDDVAALETRVRAMTRPWRHFSTAIGEALLLTGELFRDMPCTRQVIDVSGDGASNEGPPPAPVRDALNARGITINALAILSGGAPNLAAYFRDHVITGKGAFVYTASSHEDYPRAIRRKLLDEITEPVS